VSESEPSYTPGDDEPFYTPDPALFSNSNAYLLFTRYATELVEAGLADRFPADAELRKVAIELLAERYHPPLEWFTEEPELIPEAIEEARMILDRERGQSSEP
jgi:hypothetical protein